MTMLIGPPVAPVPPPPPRETGPWPVVAAVAAGVWAVLVTVPGQVTGWLVDQVVLVTGLDRAVAVWPVVAAVTVLLVGAPVLALALLPRSPALRATGRAWAGGALTLGAATLLRALPPVHHEAYLAALAVTAALLALAAARLARRRPPTPATTAGLPGPIPADGPATATGPTGPRAADGGTGPAGRGGARPGAVTLLAVAAGLAMLLPWVWVGALGGALETLLAGLAAAALGMVAGVLLGPGFWAAFAAGPTPRPVRLVLLGGLVAGVTLTMLAAGAGQSGAQLPGLLLLPPLGFVLAALEAAARRAGRPAGAGPARWLVGLALAGPLAFTDPEEITLLLASSRDVPFWVAVGTGAAFAVAVLLAVGYAVLLARRHAGTPRRGWPGWPPGPCWPPWRWCTWSPASRACTASGCWWCCASRRT